MFDQLVIHVARDVSAEQRLHHPLLASFDEILVGRPGEERHAHGGQRLRHVEPQAVLNDDSANHVQPPIASSVPRRRSERQEGGEAADREAGGNDAGHPDSSSMQGG